MTGAPIAIRVDATQEIALGHLRRCLSLAYALRRQNVAVKFMSYDNAVTRNMLESAGFEHCGIETDAGSPDDAKQTVRTAGGMGAEIVVVDSYSVGPAYFEALRRGGLRIVYFEDYCNPDIAADCIVNGLPGAEEVGYIAPIRLLGPEYLVLAPEYGGSPEQENSARETDRLLITMGGVDHYNLSGRLLRILNAQDYRGRLDIVAGPYYENTDEIEATLQELPLEAQIHYAPQSLHALIRGATIAISAGGLTLYELAAMGIPTLAISLWENQRRNVEELGRRDVVLPLFYCEDPAFDQDLATGVRSLVADGDLGRKLARNGRALVDGRGAERTAHKIHVMNQESAERS